MRHILAALMVALSTLCAPSLLQAKTAPVVDTISELHGALRASRQWVEWFNASDIDACADAYTTDAVVHAKPFGTYSGRDAIRTFWKDLVDKGARDLRYSKIKVDQVDAKTVLITASWSMNIGGGIITKERWVNIGSRWLLAEDSFEVLYQNQ